MQYCPSPGGVSVLWQRRSLGSGKLPLFLSPPLGVCALLPGAQLGAPLCSPGAHSFAAQPSPPPPPPCSSSSSFPQPAAAMADSASESDTDGAGGNSSSSAAMQSSCSSTSGGGGGGSGGGGGGGGKSGGIVISPFRLEELTNRLASLQQENKVLKIELETYKLKCKALQEENRDLRKASVTIVSAPRGRAAAPTSARLRERLHLDRAAPELPEAPENPQQAHSLPRTVGSRGVWGREVSLRGHASLSSPGGSDSSRGVGERCWTTTFPFRLWGGGPSREVLEAGGVAGGRGGTFFSPSKPKGCVQSLGLPRLWEREEPGVSSRGLTGGAGGCVAGLGTSLASGRR